MTRTEQAELEELHMTPEQLQERTERVTESLRANLAPAPEQPQPETRTRAPRSDKGEPRIFIDAPGVRFDLMHIEGRASFEYWLARAYQEGGAVFGNAAVKQLLTHIDRLSARKAD